jgi:hypothetical protein
MVLTLGHWLASMLGLAKELRMVRMFEFSEEGWDIVFKWLKISHI